MELISRGRLSREPSIVLARELPRRSSPVAIGNAPRGFRPVIAGGPRIGCGDPMEAARLAAGQCGAPQAYNANVMQQGPGGIYGAAPENLSPENCHLVGLRYVPIGAAFTAVAAATATSCTISPGAPFLPYGIVLGPTANADDLIVTGIKYGVTDMLIGGSLNGELFVNTSMQQGYRLPSRGWVVPGQTIVISGTSIGAIAANALFGQVYGFTSAP